MAFFGRKRTVDSAPLAGAPVSRPPATRANSVAVPLDLAGVKAEFESTVEDGFSQGWEMFENPLLEPTQRCNAAEYLTRSLRAELHSRGSSGLGQDKIREGCRRTVILAGRTPHEPSWQDQFAKKYLRLGIILIKVNGWHPAEFGGDGSIKLADLDVERTDLLIAAIAPGTSSAPDALQSFLARPL
jgi:hypothetical protein